MSKEELKKLQKKVMQTIKIYRDEKTDGFFAKFKFKGHYEVHSIDSPIFYAYLNSSLRALTNKYDTANWHELLKVEEENSLLNDDPVAVYKRIAGDEKSVWYFLADRDWSCVYVNKEGWTVIGNYDKLFTKRKNMLKQAVPVSSNTGDRLRNFVNLNDNDYLLFKINLIHNFFYKSSHYIGIINANFGQGKSMLTRLWRRIVDPAKAEFTSLSPNIDDFKIQLANNDFVMLDNTRKMNNAFSDVICGAVTGSSFSLRQLYTDFTEIILDVKNIFVINGIDIVPRREDLLSRCLLFELLPLNDDNRRTEAEFWASFEKELPYILGDIFDTICKALKILETLGNKTIGRMADANREMFAIALALGVSAEEFYRLILDNQVRLKEACARENDFIMAILDYMESQSKEYIIGKVSDVYTAIKEFKQGDLKNYPKSPSSFSRKINEQKSLLLSAGISVTTIEKKDGTHITITRSNSVEK